MKLQLEIDLDITPRAKSAIRWILLPVAVLMGSAAIAHAFDMSWIASGQKVSSMKLKEVLSEVDTRLVALENGTTSAVPPGTIIAFAGTVAPAGWVDCDGRPYDGSGALYKRLYEAIGVAYGGTASAFKVPDLRGRVVIGVGTGPSLKPRALGAFGGEEAHVMQLNELAQHAHVGSTSKGASIPYRLIGGAGGSSSAGQGPGFQSGGSFVDRTDGDYPFANHYHDFTTSTVPAAPAVGQNVMQPFVVAGYLIKL